MLASVLVIKSSSIPILFGLQERATLIGLTNLWTNGRSVMPPELNVKRAVFVLGKIDEILAWDKTQAHERDLRFVDLGRYLCEVRAGQYWRLDKMKSFDDFLERRFPPEGVLPHGHPRTSAADPQAGAQAGGVVEGDGPGESGAQGWGAV